MISSTFGFDTNLIVVLVPVPDLFAHEVLSMKLAVSDPTETVLVLHGSTTVMRLVRVHWVNIVFFDYETGLYKQLRNERNCEVFAVVVCVLTSIDVCVRIITSGVIAWYVRCVRYLDLTIEGYAVKCKPLATM